MEKELLEEFADYCHEFYRGSALENGEYIYSYSGEVVNFIDGFLEQRSKK